MRFCSLTFDNLLGKVIAVQVRLPYFTHNPHTTAHTPVTASEEIRPPFCTTTGSSLVTLIPAVLQLQLFRLTIYVPIDTCCLQTNIICTRVAALLGHDGGQTYDTDIVLTAGVGRRSYGVHMAFKAS